MPFRTNHLRKDPAGSIPDEAVYESVKVCGIYTRIDIVDRLRDKALERQANEPALKSYASRLRREDARYVFRLSPPKEGISCGGTWRLRVSRTASADVLRRTKRGDWETPILAILDTDADWSVLNTEIAEELDLFRVEGEPITLSTRFGPIAGYLVQAPVTLLLTTAIP